jgi:hypothetical protein
MPWSDIRESKEAAATRPLFLIFLAIIIAGCAKSKAVEVPPPPTPASPSRKLSPQVGREEEEQLREEARAKIAGAEQMVQRINQKTLAKDQQDILATIHSFLAKAREALAIKDFSRASNLANKALILAQELSGTIQ